MAAKRKRRKNVKNEPDLFDTPEVYKEDSVDWQRLVEDLKGEIDQKNKHIDKYQSALHLSEAKRSAEYEAHEQTKRDLSLANTVLDQTKKDLNTTQAALDLRNKELDATQKAKDQITLRYNDLKDRNNVVEGRLKRVQDIIDEDKEINILKAMDDADSTDCITAEDSCLSYHNNSIIEKVRSIVKAFYNGSHTNMALIEVALFDHSLLKKRREHTAFIKTLMSLNIIKSLSTKEFNKLVSGMASKFSRLPNEGYRSWGKGFENDKAICIKIAEMLGNGIPYYR